MKTRLHGIPRDTGILSVLLALPGKVRKATFAAQTHRQDARATVMPKISQCFFLLLAILAPTTALAQSPPASNPAVGLDSLGDQALLAELASLGSDDLLNRVFDQDHIAPARREAIRSLGSLDRLGTDSKLTDAQQQQLISNVVTHIDEILDVVGNNPELLVQQGRILVDKGIEREVGVLEYWGPTDAEKARLRPIAQACVKMFDKAAASATARANDIANRITSPDDKLGDAYHASVDLANTAAYLKARMQYALALSTDIADPQRQTIINEALATLAQWDNGDSTIQPQIRIYLAKLRVLLGDKDDAKTARKLLDSITSAPPTVSPAPTPFQVYESRCFGVVADLAAGDLAGARRDLTAATDYQTKNFPNDPSQIIPLRLLGYRILALAADQTPPGPDHDSANNQAVTSLLKILADYPSLRNIIYRQIALRLPQNPDLSKLDPLLLAAMVDQGREEILAAAPDHQPDKTRLKNALAAAQEILARNKAGTIPADQAIDASLLIGVFQESLGDKFAAANSLLDHLARFGDNPAAKSDFALDRVQNLIAELRQATPVDPHGNLDPRVDALRQRFFPIAINPPFNHKEFALEYAKLLLDQQKWAEAEKYYAMVPDTDDPLHVLTARYGELLAVNNQLEADLHPSANEKSTLTARVQKLADQVNSTAANVIKTTDSDTKRAYAKTVLANMSLLAADITRREQNDPNRVLQLLEGFEDSVAGLPDAHTMLNAALFLRVQAYMQLGRNNDATSTLVKYLQGTNGNESAQTAHDLLETLNTELDKAKAQEDAATAAGDSAAAQTAQDSIRQLAANRAMLSGFLVKWAQDSTDPRIHSFAYTYRRFDADTKRLAATLEQDPDARKKDLLAVIDLYKQLQSPENDALYLATLDPSADKTYPDPLVMLGIGLTAYELGDYPTVKDMLGRLIHDGKLGEDNDQYWEASYKLLDSMAALANSNDPQTKMEDVQQSLKLLYINYRNETGGRKYHDKFEALRKQILPDWTPPGTAATMP